MVVILDPYYYPIPLIPHVPYFVLPCIPSPCPCPVYVCTHQGSAMLGPKEEDFIEGEGGSAALSDACCRL